MIHSLSGPDLKCTQRRETVRWQTRPCRRSDKRKEKKPAPRAQPEPPDKFLLCTHLAANVLISVLRWRDIDISEAGFKAECVFTLTPLVSWGLSVFRPRLHDTPDIFSDLYFTEYQGVHKNDNKQACQASRWRWSQHQRSTITSCGPGK